MLRIYANKDTWLNRDSQSQNYGSQTTALLGCHGSGDEYALMLAFDLSELPDRAAIASAKLYMQQCASLSKSTVTFDVYSVTGSWNENSITWNSMPVKIETPKYTKLTVTKASADTWDSFDFTGIVKDLKTNPGYTVELKNHDITDSADRRYYCYTKESGSGRQPYLEIDYTLPCKVYNGGWTDAHGIKVYDGTQWQDAKHMKIYNGTEWKEVF